jgi:hypothetical protein
MPHLTPGAGGVVGRGGGHCEIELVSNLPPMRRRYWRPPWQPLLLLLSCGAVARCEILKHSQLECSLQRNKQTGRPSCSPIVCTHNIEPTCSAQPAGDGAQAASPPPPAQDHAAWLSQLECKICKQSRDGVCMRLSSYLQASSPHVKAAYCTDDFLVIHSAGLPQAALKLDSIPQPAAGAGCRIRTAREAVHIFKIPLRPQASTAPNTIAAPLPKGLQLPAEGPVGVAIDGVPLYTNYNLNGMYTWASCELDACNGHVHASEDYHCEIDQATCPPRNTCAPPSACFPGSAPLCPDLCRLARSSPPQTTATRMVPAASIRSPTTIASQTTRP